MCKSPKVDLDGWNTVASNSMIPPILAADPLLEIERRDGQRETGKCSTFIWNRNSPNDLRIVAWRNTEESELFSITEEIPERLFDGPLVDHGAHYRYEYNVPVTSVDYEQGFVMVKLDPFRISAIYGELPAPQFTMLKKVLRLGTSVKDKKQDYLDIISAAERGLEMLEEDQQ